MNGENASPDPETNPFLDEQEDKLSDAATFTGGNAKTRDVVFASMRDKGVSKHIAAAILGDIEQESGFNYRLSGDNGTSWGLLQVGTPMFRQFEQEQIQKGVLPRNPNYVYNQVPFILDRFQKQYPGRWQAMEDADSAEDALRIFRGSPGWGYGVEGSRFAHAAQYDKALRDRPLTGQEIRERIEPFTTAATAGKPTKKSVQAEQNPFLGSTKEDTSEAANPFIDTQPDQQLQDVQVTGSDLPQATVLIPREQKSRAAFHSVMDDVRRFGVSTGKYIFEGIEGVTDKQIESLEKEPAGLTFVNGFPQYLTPEDAQKSLSKLRQQSEWLKKKSARLDMESGVDPELATTLDARIASAAGPAAVAVGESLIPVAGIPLMAIHGASVTNAEALKAGKDQHAAEMAAVQSFIGLAIFGGANRLAALTVAKLVPAGAPRLFQYLSQFMGQGTANEITTRAIKAWDASQGAPVGDKLAAATKVFTTLPGVNGEANKQQLSDSVFNAVYAAVGAVRPSIRSPIKMEGRQNAKQRSNAQVQARETAQREQARANRDEGVTSESDSGQRAGERAARGTAQETEEIPQDEVSSVDPELERRRASEVIEPMETVTPKSSVRVSEAWGTETTPVASFIQDRGGLISKSMALKKGKTIVGLGLWDGTPRELTKLPFSNVYKKGGLMPDDMAQALYEEGLIPEASSGEMWDALEQEVNSTKRTAAAVRQQEKAEFDAGIEHANWELLSAQERTREKQRLEPTLLNSDNGAKKPPPPTSIFSPANDRPNSDPDKGVIQRGLLHIRDWWEKMWPRSWAAIRLNPDTPVITAYERMLNKPFNFMRNFWEQGWAKELRQMGDDKLREETDAASLRFDLFKSQGMPNEVAFEKAISPSPKGLQEYFKWRESRRAIEEKARAILGLAEHDYIAGPYAPRLTKREAISLRNLKGGNYGGELRQSIGSFSRSREYRTMEEGITNGVEYEPILKSIFSRELYSSKLEATAGMFQELRDGGVMFDKRAEALEAPGAKDPKLIEDFGAHTQWVRTRQEARFLEQALSPNSMSPLTQITHLSTSLLRDPNFINPLPHATKNMLFKYILARVTQPIMRRDAAEFARGGKLRDQFERYMPMTEHGERMSQIRARIVGNWWDKLMTAPRRLTAYSSNFVFGKADPAMRYGLWKSYLKKGFGPQEAANHVWLDLIRYNENSGALDFWRNIPLNFFATWRTGSLISLAKNASRSPVRSLMFIGGIDYLREVVYRNTGLWTHMPHDYLEAPIAQAFLSQSPRDVAMIAGTTLLFGPGGGQAPLLIGNLMNEMKDPNSPSGARIRNTFWGISLLYNVPAEFKAFEQDNDPSHLVKILASGAFGTHSALRYEPRRLMKWLPEWLPGMHKSGLVTQAELWQSMYQQRQQKRMKTVQGREDAAPWFETEEERIIRERAPRKRSSTDLAPALVP